MNNHMNENLGFYGNLDTVTNRMAGMLLANKDFVKYLSYTENDPLSMPDITNPIGIIGKRFFLQPKPPILIIEEGTYVEMFLARDNPQGRSGGKFTEYIITFNIICHLNSWQVLGGMRPYRIMNIIDKTFNNAKIKDISVGDITPLGSQFIRFSDQFEGYKLGYVLSWNGNLDC